jgi:hypothetical protein
LLVWLWEADGSRRFRGVSDDENAARLAAARCITSGRAETATVEAASLVLGVSSLSDFYYRTGAGWRARGSGAGVCWVPLAAGMPA